MSKTYFEDLSTELLMLIFDYLTSIEILVTFFHLNKRFRLIVYYYLKSGYKLTKLNLLETNFLTYKLFLKNILPDLKSTITSFEYGNLYSYGQIDYFNQYQLQRLDTLKIIFIDSNSIGNILEKFLNYNRLQWFDQITLILNEDIIGWNEKLPFCVQNIPVKKLNLYGEIPYVFAQHLMTGCYTITHLKIHLKYDHDLLPILYYLPNLIECYTKVHDRGRDISNDITLLAPLSSLKVFQYKGLMPSIYLRRLIKEINVCIEYLTIFTQDYQWSFHISEGFSSEFFEYLKDLKTFEFYFRLITSENIRLYIKNLKYLIEKNLCQNIGYVLSKDLSQIFSLPYAFKNFEIFEKKFFNQISYLQYEEFNLWDNIQHLTLHMNIYDLVLLKLIKEKFRKLRTIDYQVPHFCLVPEDYELHQYDLQFNTIKKLTIRDSVKHGCHVPEPLFLLTFHLNELDIDHFYLMQIISIVSQQTRSRIVTILNRLQRLTVRQYDERLTDYFFSYFSNLKIIALIFLTYKMQVYRTKLPFLDDLLHSIPNLISLKFEHIKRPHEYYAYKEMQQNVQEKFSEYYKSNDYYCQWYHDHTQKHHNYATFLFSK